MNFTLSPISIISCVNYLSQDASVFKDIIGQDDAKKKLTFFIESNSKETPFPTVLFTGSQGLGKSHFASKVAKSLKREFVEINCSTFDTSQQFIDEIIYKKVMGTKEKTLLLDESHKLNSEITNLLLTILNPNVDNKNYLSYNGVILEYDFTRINIIFATTDAHRMFKPLLNRCQEVYFTIYNNEELFNILQFYLKDIEFTCSRDDVAYACRGRARDAFILSQNIKRYCIKNKTNVLDSKGWCEIRNIFDFHLNGLNSQEINYLNILKDCSPIACRSIAIKMGVNEQNIESEIEIRPIELGYVTNGTKGRSLSDSGFNYLELLEKNNC